MAEIPQSLCEPQGCGKTPRCQSRSPLQPPWMQLRLLCLHCFLQMPLCSHCLVANLGATTQGVEHVQCCPLERSVKWYAFLKSLVACSGRCWLRMSTHKQIQRSVPMLLFTACQLTASSMYKADCSSVRDGTLSQAKPAVCGWHARCCPPPPNPPSLPLPYLQHHVGCCRD